jgi:hypothetical protein
MSAVPNGGTGKQWTLLQTRQTAQTESTETVMSIGIIRVHKTLITGVNSLREAFLLSGYHTLFDDGLPSQLHSTNLAASWTLTSSLNK